MAQQELPGGAVVPDINALIQQRGPEFIIGGDTQRIWATGMQAFVNPDFTMIVFREQTFMQFPADAPPGVVLRNVASIVVPTAVFKEFHAASVAAIAALTPEAPNAI